MRQSSRAINVKYSILDRLSIPTPRTFQKRRKPPSDSHTRPARRFSSAFFAELPQFQSPGLQGLDEGELEGLWGGVGEGKGEAPAWPLSFQSTQGPQSLGKSSKTARNSGPSQWPTRHRPTSGRESRSARARGRGRGRARWRRRLRGRAPQPGQQSEREGQDRYKTNCAPQIISFIPNNLSGMINTSMVSFLKYSGGFVFFFTLIVQKKSPFGMFQELPKCYSYGY